MKCSILISTYNRATHLRETLASLGRVQVPQGIQAEAVIIDNRSTDETPEVIHNAHSPVMPIRYLHEPRPGKSHALNRALAATQSDILLFTDDDIRFPTDWIERMCLPIRQGGFHGVVGGVKTAPHLIRPEIDAFCYELLADTGNFDPKNPTQMVGANMAIAREVFSRIPAFDPELGPAGHGSGEEGILTLQFLCAGFRLATALNVTVEHHFEEFRLQRKSFVALADKVGRSTAYVLYHWDHYGMTKAPARLMRERLCYLQWRLHNAGESRREFGIHPTEMNFLVEIAKYQQWKIESSRPRNYEKHGLVKINGIKS